MKITLLVIIWLMLAGLMYDQGGSMGIYIQIFFSLVLWVTYLYAKEVDQPKKKRKKRCK